MKIVPPSVVLKHPGFSTALWFGLVLLALPRPEAADAPKLELTTEPAWPALASNVVDLFIPPTRPREPFAATAHQVFHVAEGQTNWVPVYTVPSLPAAILGIHGYAKASAVLYVAHTVGVARTRDSGASWLESVPPDYRVGPRAFVGLAVNPINRREAAIATRAGLWLTRDFGESFNRVDLPAPGEPLLAIAYAGDNADVLAVLTERALHLTSSAGESWATLPHVSPGQALLAVLPSLPAALVAAPPGTFIAYDLNRPGFRAVRELRDFELCGALAADCAGHGLLWAACGAELRLYGLAGERVQPLARCPLPAPAQFLRSHPRVAEQVFFAAGGQVMLARVDESVDIQTLSNLWNFAAFSSGPVQESKAGAITRAVATDSDIQGLLRQLMAAEPALDEFLSAALKHARYHDAEITRWKKRSKARNWLPQLRVGTGVREYPVDQSEVFDYVDRYGITQRDYLRLPDRIEPMGFVSVAVVWDLSRLLFDPEEVDINKEKRYEIKQRNELAAQVTALYYERLDLLLRNRLRGDKMTTDERIAGAIKLHQKTDLLNQLCGKTLLGLPPER